MKSPIPTVRPPIRLLLGPSGSGKTDTALHQFCNDISTSLLVVTSAAQAEWMGRSVASATGMPLTEARERILPFTAIVAELLRQDREYRQYD